MTPLSCLDPVEDHAPMPMAANRLSDFRAWLHKQVEMLAALLSVSGLTIRLVGALHKLSCRLDNKASFRPDSVQFTALQYLAIWFSIASRIIEDRLFQLGQHLGIKRLQVTQLSVLPAMALNHQQ
ncbi:hypothetical protein RHS01_01706 [Rhizoctonia solani]|uniref:Uncharacterized protein n=1 Tax=Rhizoctonia solani TaxID=456999 RepID=A0A8H7M8K5_9AGAM|nr:hypothetical protein RHS01_01706 [Rhizoctonia solani]